VKRSLQRAQVAALPLLFTAMPPVSRVSLGLERAAWTPPLSLLGEACLAGRALLLLPLPCHSGSRVCA
jgi:hypothetical protein